MEFVDSFGGVAPGPGRLVVAERGGPLAALRARVSPHRLDLALANGAPAEATPAIASRARRLIALCTRRSIATSYRRIVSDARAGRRGSRHRVVLERALVTAAADELMRLADALAEPGPVAPRGVAQALLLLTDGAGPLYNRGSESSVREYAARATESLEPATNV